MNFLSILIIFILLIVIGICIRLIYISNKKINIYEEWIHNFARTVETIDDELDRIDSEGIFRSDDEVGFFYQSMHSILKRLYDYRILVNAVTTVPDNANNELQYTEQNNEILKRIKKRRQNDIEIEDIQGMKK